MLKKRLFKWNGRVILLCLTRVEADIYPGYAAEILAMHVNQERQKQGVGGALLKHTTVELQKRGCPPGYALEVEVEPGPGLG